MCVCVCVCVCVLLFAACSYVQRALMCRARAGNRRLKCTQTDVEAHAACVRMRRACSCGVRAQGRLGVAVHGVRSAGVGAVFKRKTAASGPWACEQEVALSAGTGKQSPLPRSRHSATARSFWMP